MAIEDEALKKMRERDAFAENDIADGIALRGIDKGHATAPLSSVFWNSTCRSPAMV